MHTDLSPHLHTEECNKIIQAFVDCQAYYTFQKYLGACNDIYRDMTKCTKRERQRKRDENARKAKIDQAARLQRILAYEKLQEESQKN